MRIHLTLSGLLGIAFLLTVACSTAPPEDTTPASIKKAATLLSHGIRLYGEYDFDTAQVVLQQALVEYRRIDNPRGMANSSLSLARLSQAMNQLQDSRYYLSMAEDIIKTNSLNDLQPHLAIQQSTQSIIERDLNTAKNTLADYLKTTDKQADIQLAALQNRTRIAFLENAEDKVSWLQRYREKISKPDSSHAARALRFEAELIARQAEQSEIAAARLSQALEIYHRLANQPGTAATLEQWATLDIRRQNNTAAENKLRRALFIRQHLHDRQHCATILQQLTLIYQQTTNPMLATTTRWGDTLSRTDPIAWSRFIADFDTYPGIVTPHQVNE